MSVIIIYQHDNTINSLEFRGFEETIGIDFQGNISTKNIVEKIFSINSIGKDYVLNIENQKIVIPKSLKINIKNINFFFYVISPTAETLSYSNFTNDINLKDISCKELKISFLSNSIYIKIYEGIEYFIGSSIYASVYVNSKEFAPYHAKILYNGERIEVKNITDESHKEQCIILDSENEYRIGKLVFSV